MASIQETLRAALGADPTLTSMVGDRIFPGEIPDDEDTPPWLFYSVPSSLPQDDLDAEETDVQHQVEFHALGNTYATAKAIIDTVKAVLNTFRGGQIRRAFWLETSEEQTEEGYHHVARFTVWGTDSNVTTVPGGSARVVAAGDTVTLSVNGHTLTLDPDGLLLDGAPVGTGGSGNLDGGTPDSIYGGLDPIDGGTP